MARPTRPNTSEFVSNLFDADADLLFPRQFDIVGKVHRNPIRRVSFLEHGSQCKITPFSTRRATGYVATAPTGRKFFLCSKPTSAELPTEDVLLVAGAANVEGIQQGLFRNAGRWLHPKPLDISSERLDTSEERCRAIVDSWKGMFQFRPESRNAESGGTTGLRVPQIGALHATLAHWSVTTSPATGVMPTGTGKTETMLALLTCVGLNRLMVVVPSNALRDQITEKFLTLGVLERCGAMPAGTKLPVVATLLHRPRSPQEVDDLFRRANIIVSTMNVAGQCTIEVQRRMAELCSHLFIDEAHHIAARTWKAFKDQFADRPIIQFTATPFRTDGKRVDGKFIYTYPLAKAQNEGYFRRINFIPIAEIDPDEADLRIARKAIERLDADRDAGHDHVLMARVDTIDRADALLKLYRREGAKYNPVVIHTRTTKADRDARLQSLRSRDSRVVICVDMFGEGFDFPELKVAALHDRHKSLAITLQFIGRFTRTQTNIGEASVIANIADDAISNALRNLYAEDADWNFLLRMLSEGATERARKRHELLEGFTSTLADIPLQSLFPRMSAVVYRTKCEEWQPMRIEDAISGVQLHAGPVINPAHNLAIFVTRDEQAIRWGAIKQIQDIEWNLYVIHWNEALRLLFINSSSKDFHEHIAEAVAGPCDRASGEVVFRTLGNIRRLTLTNPGLSHSLGKNIRYTMFMGADIAEGLSEAQRLNRRKSNLFGLGFESDEKVTVGCSFKGRLWSHRVAYDLSEWIDWCAHVGAKLLDDTIDTNEVFAHVIKARRLDARPPLVPVMVSWPEDFQSQPEEMVDLQIGTITAPFFECHIEITAHSDSGPLLFDVVAQSQRATFAVRITEDGATFHQTAGPTASGRVRNNRKALADWFNHDPPIIHFANGDFLVFNELFELPRGTERVTFDPDKITVWDWRSINLRKESQGEGKDATSIQRRTIERVLAGDFGNFEIVFDDDGAGEIADVVAIRQTGNRVTVDLFHCKYSRSEEPGARIDDFYAVCGQAQKCVRWREDPRKLLKHILHRESLRTKVGRGSRFEVGDKRTIQQLLNTFKELSFEYRVYIVQPGLSKAQLSAAHMDVLGATGSFLLETYTMPLRVIASA
jgi:superfamily II DNA or RNA helicase